MRINLITTTSLTIGLFAALALVPVNTARCQTIASLRAGESVRINVNSPTSHRIQGRLLSLSPDTITLRGPSQPVAVWLSDVSLLEVKRRSGGSLMRSIAYGLLGGVVGGAAIGVAGGATNTGDGILTAGDKALIGGVLGGIAGLVGGTVYGACCASSWRAVPLPRSR